MQPLKPDKLLRALAFLPPDFLFSQGNLQDYVDCPRRFQLRYLLQISWPAVESEPVLEQERHMRQGQAFHRLVQQHLTGLPEETLRAEVAGLAATIPGSDLERWWNNYLLTRPADLPGRHYAELNLAATLAGFRLVAQFDLLVIAQDGRITIVDWKTDRRKSSSERLISRLQTRVYRFLAARAGGHLTRNGKVKPEQVEMIYWYANFPDQPERLPYDQSQYDADESYLSALIKEIAANRADVFNLTTDERRCLYCSYRSLCERGVRAGDFDASEAEWEPDLTPPSGFDFEQIAEIRF